MKIDTLSKQIDVVSVQGPCSAEVHGVFCDSRQVRPGGLFVAIPGRQEDGWVYAGDAVTRGAVAVVSEHPAGRSMLERAGQPECGSVCFIQVADARLALARLADEFCGHPSGRMNVIGITGTNGKTTTAYLVRDILKTAGKCPGMLTTVQYEIGERTIPALRTTPEAPSLQNMLGQMVHAGCQSAVMEVSSHALDQKRVEGIDFDVGVFTNLTWDHLDYHVTMESYFEAKKKLFTGLGRQKKKAFGVINTDDEWGRKLLRTEGMAAEMVTFGTDSSADVRAEEISVTPNGTKFRVATPWGSTGIRSNLLGRFNLSNSLAALSACGCLGIDLEEAARALSETHRVSGRLEEITNSLGIQVFVDYAHTDDALKNVLGTLRELTRNRLIVVFGCGGDRDRSKRPAMGRVAERMADYSILTSDNPRSEDPLDIIRAIEKGFERNSTYEVIEDRKEAIERAISLTGPGTVVLIAGKGHEKFQEVASKTLSFDDCQVAREAMRE